MSEKKEKEKRKGDVAKSLRNDLTGVINGFYAEERGNRLTSNNLEGLLSKIVRAIEPYEEKDKEGKGT